MQATLSETETLFARAPVPLWVVDAGTGEVLDVNDAACRTFGYTRCRFLELGPREIGPLPPRNGHAAVRRLRRGDGSEIHVELAAERVELEGCPAWLVSAHDVTARVVAERERLRAERARFDALFRDAPAMVAAVEGPDHVFTAEELRQSEERFRIAARATNDVVWDWDLVLGRVVWNEALETVLGHRQSSAQAPAEWWIEQLHPDDRERVVAGLYEVVDGNGAAWHDEYRIRRGDGGWATVLDRGYVLRDPDGTAVRMIGAMEDVTRRKQLEAQLVEAKRLESVGRLAGGVAHDFNNLLTAITGYTEMLLSDVEPGGEMHTDLLEIRNAAARATGLTRQLLAFSRRQVLQPRVLNLNATIRGLERMFRRLLREDVRLKVELDPAAGHVRADPAQVEQVLLNLAVNARDAMPAGGTLRITTRAAVVGPADGLCVPPVNVRPGRYVVISASDTGEGIAPEVLPQIFEPFFTTKPAGLGTGLGLATVYGIINQSGGTVWAESEPGRGATFHVYLPATDELPGAVAATARPPRTSAAGTGTVLLVDDDAAVRTFVRTVLSGAGYRVMEAADGAQALHVAGECGAAVDLLLTDVVMPRMGGRDLADEVARRWPGLPTLFMSGYTDDALADHGVLDPTVMLLEKPFSREALLDHVREALARGAVVSAG